MKYKFLNFVDAPKRILTLTIDEIVVAGTSFMWLFLTNQKIGIGLIGMSLFSALRFLKKGAGPKVLLVLAYWYLPRVATQFFLPSLPPSHCRIWVA